MGGFPASISAHEFPLPPRLTKSCPPAGLGRGGRKGSATKGGLGPSFGSRPLFFPLLPPSRRTGVGGPTASPKYGGRLLPTPLDACE